MRHLLLALSVAASLGGTAAARPDADDAPFYTAGSQYTATFDQTDASWRLHPGNGQDIRIATGRCQTGAMAEPGLWLIVPDGRGHLDLVAPSTTAVRPGRPTRVPMRPCDEAVGAALAVPQTVLDLLAGNTSAVFVNR
jgi:hypothetical protein